MADTPYYLKSDHQVLDTDRCLKLGLSTDKYNAVNQSRDDVWRDWPTNYGGAGGDGATRCWCMMHCAALTTPLRSGSVPMVGAEELFSFAHDTLQLHLSGSPNMTLTWRLWCWAPRASGLTVVELAGAYSIFNDGKFTTPHYWTEIYDSDGNLYLDNSKRVTTVQAIDPDSRYHHEPSAEQRAGKSPVRQTA